MYVLFITIFIVILLVALVWIPFTTKKSKIDFPPSELPTLVSTQEVTPTSETREMNVETFTLSRLGTDIGLITEEVNLPVDINLISHPKYAKTQGNDVYICLWKYSSSQSMIFDYNTLLYVTLHETTHVLIGDDMDENEEDPSHGRNFRLLFNHLLLTASNLGLYNPQSPIDNEYPECDSC